MYKSSKKQVTFNTAAKVILFDEDDDVANLFENNR